MRKIAMFAIAVTALFGVVAVAQASNTYTVTVAKVSPSKAGTALKPKPITINFGYQVGETANNRPSVTTDYVIAFGKQIKSHRSFFKGSKVCTVAQAGYSSGQPPKCPATAKAGAGSIQNFAGNTTDPTSKIPCNLGLTLFVGDGKTVPAAANDGIAVKNDLVLAIKRVNVSDCALAVDAALPAGFVDRAERHGAEVPRQEDAVPAAPAGRRQLGRQRDVERRQDHQGPDQGQGRRRLVTRQVTRGLFESIGCKSSAHKVNVAFTPAGGGSAINASKTAPCTK